MKTIEQLRQELEAARTILAANPKSKRASSRFYAAEAAMELATRGDVTADLGCSGPDNRYQMSPEDLERKLSSGMGTYTG